MKTTIDLEVTPTNPMPTPRQVARDVVLAFGNDSERSINVLSELFRTRKARVITSPARAQEILNILRHSNIIARDVSAQEVAA